MACGRSHTQTIFVSILYRSVQSAHAATVHRIFPQTQSHAHYLSSHHARRDIPSVSTTLYQTDSFRLTLFEALLRHHLRPNGKRSSLRTSQISTCVLMLLVPLRASDMLGWARITVHDQGDERTGRPLVSFGIRTPPSLVCPTPVAHSSIPFHLSGPLCPCRVLHLRTPYNRLSHSALRPKPPNSIKGQFERPTC